MKGRTNIIIQGDLDKQWKNSFGGINMKENAEWLF